MPSDTRGSRCGIWPIQIGGWARPACEWHDMAYTALSKQQTYISRKQVDQQFRRQLLELAQRGRFRFGKRIVAHIFYGLARAFGGRYWEGRP